MMSGLIVFSGTNSPGMFWIKGC